MDLYREAILDHYKHPRNFGHLARADRRGQAYNATCGDRIVIELKLKMKNSKPTIEDIKFSGEGCAISQASASMLTEKVKGKEKREVVKLKLKDVTTMLGTTLTPSRVKCAMLPLEVLQKALVNV